MFKIGLENRDFCKSLHFYIVDAGKKKKKKKRAASAGLFNCSRPFGPSASPEGRCPHYFFSCAVSCAAGRLPAPWFRTYFINAILAKTPKKNWGRSRRNVKSDFAKSRTEILAFLWIFGGFYGRVRPFFKPLWAQRCTCRARWPEFRGTKLLEIWQREVAPHRHSLFSLVGLTWYMSGTWVYLWHPHD